MNRYKSPSGNIALPSHVDWRLNGSITHVKNQGQCGSCYAFAVTGAVESHHFIKTGELTSLSERQLVDCTKPNGNLGCRGGYLDATFKFIHDNGGMATEETYPYRNTNRYCSKAKKNNTNAGVTVRELVEVGVWARERRIREILANIGPVAVVLGICDRLRFLSYTDGIYYQRTCTPVPFTHAALFVGYGTHENREIYYIVKNR